MRRTAVGAIEYMFIHEVNYYRHAIPGLLAASFGWGIYWVLLRTSFLGIYSFPNNASPRLIDLGWAILLGFLGANRPGADDYHRGWSWVSILADTGGEVESVGPAPPRGRDKSGTLSGGQVSYGLDIASLVVLGNSPPVSLRVKALRTGVMNHALRAARQGNGGVMNHARTNDPLPFLTLFHPEGRRPAVIGFLTARAIAPLLPKPRPAADSREARTP